MCLLFGLHCSAIAAKNLTAHPIIDGATIVSDPGPDVSEFHIVCRVLFGCRLTLNGEYQRGRLMAYIYVKGQSILTYICIWTWRGVVVDDTAFGMEECDLALDPSPDAYFDL